MNQFLQRLQRIVAPGYRPDEACLIPAELFVQHRLDVLGSGPVHMYYGVVPAGFEGHLYPNPDDTYEALRAEADSVAPRYIPMMHRAEALAQKLVPGYQPIPWHTDIRTGYVYKLDWHTYVPVAQFPGVDAKTPSDMSRMHHWLTLAKAWRITGDRRYRSEMMAQFCDWIAANPPYYGPAWRNGMNVAVRTANIICAAALLELDAVQDSDFVELLYTSLDQHRRFIALTAEIYRPHNHIMAETAGLVLVTSLLEQEESDDMTQMENRAWERYAWRELNHEITRQINDDGFDFENSTSYHAYVLEMMLYPALVAARVKGCRTAGEIREFLVHKERLSAKALENIRNAAKVLCLLTQPDGKIPFIGDNDGGRYIPWESEDACPSDMRALSCTAALLLEDPVLLPATVRPLDFQAAAAFFDDAAVTASAFRPQSAWLSQCGYAILAGQTYHSVFRCGGSTADKGGHANNDQLSLTLCVNGQTVLVDPGTYTYTGDPSWRAKLRSITAHSTVSIDDEETDRLVALQSFGGGGSETHTVCRRFEVYPDRTVCEGAYDSLIRLPEMIMAVARTLEYRENRIDLTDTVTYAFDPPAEGRVTQRFILHPDCKVEIPDSRTAVVTANGVEARFETEGGTFTQNDAIFSPCYGVRQDTAALCVMLPRDTRKNHIAITWR